MAIGNYCVSIDLENLVTLVTLDDPDKYEKDYLRLIMRLYLSEILELMINLDRIEEFVEFMRILYDSYDNTSEIPMVPFMVLQSLTTYSNDLSDFYEVRNPNQWAIGQVRDYFYNCRIPSSVENFILDHALDFLDSLDDPIAELISIDWAGQTWHFARV